MVEAQKLRENAQINKIWASQQAKHAAFKMLLVRLSEGCNKPTRQSDFLLCFPVLSRDYGWSAGHTMVLLIHVSDTHD